MAPIGLHESRHTFASLMIGAGVNAKALAVYMGDASVTITLDRYGHLMPGNEEAAAGLLDAYLSRSAEGLMLPDGAVRSSAVAPVGYLETSVLYCDDNLHRLRVLVVAEPDQARAVAEAVEDCTWREVRPARSPNDPTFESLLSFAR